MGYYAFSYMVARPTFIDILTAFKETDHKIWDKAGFRAYIHTWEEVPFLIFIIKEKNKDLVLEVMKKSKHAMVEGAPTIISKEKIKMDLIRIAKELSNQNIVKEYNIEIFTGTEHERQALVLEDLP